MSNVNQCHVKVIFLPFLAFGNSRILLIKVRFYKNKLFSLNDISPKTDINISEKYLLFKKFIL